MDMIEAMARAMQNDELREMLADAYATGATDVHNSWVAGTNGGEPDFGESASDYATSIELPDTITALQAEVARLREENEALRGDLAKANSAHWFYYGDDCSSNRCRFDINECISEDFEWDNRAEGDHVLQISGARPVPDMWVGLHYYTNAEKDARGDDEQYTFTVHDSEEEARKALENRHD